jgi:glyoxylase-like metal-dependent hydrolase (beta-lactamase superfamily II)
MVTRQERDVADSLGEAVELVPGRLFALGGMVELDGRVSWMPPQVGGFQPVNAYLLVEGANALLVDTGLALHEESIIAQLEAALPAGCELRIYVTRAEGESIGNLGPIAVRFNAKTTYTGGVNNPFDSFDQVASVVERRLPSQPIILSGRRVVVTQTAPIKMIACFWVYDSDTETLFTADTFGHHVLTGSSYTVRATPSADAIALARIGDFTLARYWWLERIDDTRELVAGLDAVFRDRVVSRIAPGYGCIIEGRENVAKHYFAFRSFLVGIAAARQRGDPHD